MFRGRIPNNSHLGNLQFRRAASHTAGNRRGDYRRKLAGNCSCTAARAFGADSKISFTRGIRPAKGQPLLTVAGKKRWTCLGVSSTAAKKVEGMNQQSRFFEFRAEPTETFGANARTPANPPNSASNCSCRARTVSRSTHCGSFIWPVPGACCDSGG